MSDFPGEIFAKLMELPGGTTIDNKAVEFMLGAGALAVTGAVAYGIKKLSEKSDIKIKVMGQKASFSDGGGTK